MSFSSPILCELATLVAALRAGDGADDARRSALRALTRAARHDALVLRLDDAAVIVDGRAVRGAPAPAVAELLALLRAAGVAELRVRKHAGARELAQLAGALARRAGADDAAALGDELTALRLWNVRALARPGGAAVAPPAAAATLVERVRSAGDAAARAAAHEALAGWIGRTAPPEDGERDAAAHAADDAVALTLAALACGIPGEDGEARAALGRLLALPGAGRAVAESVARGVVPVDAPLVAAGAAALAGPFVDVLSHAAEFDERRRCADALLALGAGVDALVAALARDEWFVVRNVALVLGELRAEDAVRALARLLAHADDRVRAAVAVALGQIATPSSRRPLLGALRDRSVEVRRVAARAAVETARAGMPLSARLLVHALHDEADGDAAFELAEALAALGSTDAREGLLLLATGRTAGAPDSPARMAAIEVVAGLARRGDAEAATALRAITSDPDGRVRHGARNAMQRAVLRAPVGAAVPAHAGAPRRIA